MTRLIHLNGPPDIGKSPIARRYVDDHDGVLNCDIDVLRTLIGAHRGLCGLVIWFVIKIRSQRHL